MKHTPGLWHQSENYHLAVNAGKKHIAMINYYHHPDPDLDVNMEEAKANMSLIIAAPDLLAACKAALEFAEHVHFGTYGLAAESGTTAEMLQAAIAAAEGAQP